MPLILRAEGRIAQLKPAVTAVTTMMREQNPANISAVHVLVHFSVDSFTVEVFDTDDERMHHAATSLQEWAKNFDRFADGVPSTDRHTIHSAECSMSPSGSGTEALYPY